MDDLCIPACLDLRNPDVAAKRERDRLAPVTAMPAFVERKRDLDEETRKFLEAEKAREAIEKQNGLGKFNEKKKAHAATTLGGRFNSRLNRWITPEEDFAMMADKAGVTVDELRHHFEAVANHPDYPPDGCKTFAKKILATIDNGKLALEAEKALERTRRRNRRRAKAETLATISRAATNAAKTDLSMTPRQRAWIARRAKARAS